SHSHYNLHMNRLLGVLAFTLICITEAWAGPHWVRIEKNPPTLSGWIFHTSFELESKPVSGSIRLIFEKTSGTLQINGAIVRRISEEDAKLELDALSYLRKGRNELWIKAYQGRALSNPAIALELTGKDETGNRFNIQTSPEWKSPSGKVESQGDLGKEKWWTLPPLKINEADDYTQWKRASGAKAGTDPKTFKLLPGFKANLIHSAGPDEGSWVSLAIDEQGRLSIGREDKGIIRYTLNKDRTQIARTETINDDLRECRGLLYAHNSLYVNANQSKGIFRLRDTTGDGLFDEQKLLHASEGGFGHGRNGLALGKDGKIYAIHGDSIKLPTDIHDRTSPLRKKVTPFRPNEGHVIRMDPDGSNREIFCAGLRNPYGIAFNADGEAFTYDADAEFDMGTPWYRPTQIKHLTSGTDFGWRAVTGSWPAYYPDHPDNAQAMLDIGKGSPTGVAFGTKSKFPDDYRKALYVLDWTYGRILAVHLIPRGSSYTGAAEEFLRGQPLNLTDLYFGPDGAMYFITGGRKTQSALYRVHYNKPIPAPRDLSAVEIHRKRNSAEQRSNRKKFESFHDTNPPKDLRLPRTAWLGERTKLAEQYARHHHPELLKKPRWGNNWTELVYKINPKISENHLSQLNDHAIREREYPGSSSVKGIYAFKHAMEQTELPSKTLQLIRHALQPEFPAETFELNQYLAPIMIKLDPVSAVPQTMHLLQISSSQRERIHYLYHLRHAKSGWSLKDRRNYFRILNEYDAFLGGRGLPQALNKIRADATATLTEKEKKELKQELKHKPTLPPMPDLSGRKFVNQWKESDFVNDLNFENADPDKGQKIFHLALCSRCHRKGKEGYPIGPDLSYLSRRFSPQALLTEILEPSKTIAENYHTTILKLKDGRTLAGQVIPNLDYREPALQLAENPLHPNKITKVQKVDILERSESGISIMPQGLLNLMNKDEVLNLLAWLIK
ncbi:MAG: PQQ-dependent sugar dehydrogenase, partial [Verrucomicrobiota bacterium]|nr:PQQ-dependent sugar dehydrogenase [Verrucomicrobiota bacterium]